MRTAFIFLFLGCCFFGFLIYRNSIQFADTVNIRFGYTFLLVDYPQFIGTALLLLLNFFMLGGILGGGFRKRGFWALLFFTVVLDGALAYVVFQLLNS